MKNILIKMASLLGMSSTETEQFIEGYNTHISTLFLKNSGVSTSKLQPILNQSTDMEKRIQNVWKAITDKKVFVKDFDAALLAFHKQIFDEFKKHASKEQLVQLQTYVQTLEKQNSLA
ncbi:MAG: hypothetical protein WC775_04165 [Patescibacteria group bacterium]|jgi:hypothetical protein